MIPAVYAVAACLYDESHHWSAKDWENFQDDEGNQSIDVRLQVMPDGSWEFHTGDASYDQDHRGFWGAASIGPKLTRRRARQIARDLIEQVKEQYAQEPV